MEIIIFSIIHKNHRSELDEVFLFSRTNGIQGVEEGSHARQTVNDIYRFRFIRSYIHANIDLATAGATSIDSECPKRVVPGRHDKFCQTICVGVHCVPHLEENNFLTGFVKALPVHMRDDLA